MIGDSSRLRQVLVNLLGNAIKFTEFGEVAINVENDPETVGSDLLRFQVSDTGIGMTEEQMGGLFQAFAQAEASTSRRFGGTGLGLAITKHFCQMMGGDESEPGVGSTFTMKLPSEAVEMPGKQIGA